MKNILAVFRGDLAMLRNNLVAWVVILGLIVVPPLYAWFNIAACWDPYSNTGGLKVAVASVDEGYTGSLFPMTLNIGDIVLAKLRENDKLDWVFTDEADAIRGVEDGSYYAAIVLPASFSRDMMSLFVGDAQHSEILYYLNEKENAIAPKITDKGASALQQEIDEAFTQTVTEVALSLLQGLGTTLDETGMENALSHLTDQLKQTHRELSTGAVTLRAWADVVDSLAQMLAVSSDYLAGTGEATESVQTMLRNADDGLDSLAASTDTTVAAIDTMLAETAACCQLIADEIGGSLDAISNQTEGATDGLYASAGEVEILWDRLSKVRDSLALLESLLPDIGPSDHRALNILIWRLDSTLEMLDNLDSALLTTCEALNGAGASADFYQDELQELAQQSADDLEQLRQDYETDLRPKLDTLLASLHRLNGTTSSLLIRLDDAADAAADAGGAGADSLTELSRQLNESARMLEDADRKLRVIIARLETATQSGDESLLAEILDTSPEELSSFLASPVSLNTIRFYPVDNYGTAMTPFYTALAIWVGCVVLVAILKTDVSEERRAAMHRLRHWQCYLGRWLLFLIIGLAQSTLICLGDLFYLGIQCAHPLLFLVTCWIVSVIFCSVIYALAVSFGDIGKAICVVLLVIQVAGSGGTFPIQMLPEPFQKAYPLLPFPYAMNAMRECIAGFYGDTYLNQIGKLLIYLILALLLGLVLRKPVIRLNEMFIRQLESTKIM